MSRHLRRGDQALIDPLKREQWDFDVLPTLLLAEHPRSQHSITLPSLRTVTGALAWNELKRAAADPHAQSLQDDSPARGTGPRISMSKAANGHSSVFGILRSPRNFIGTLL